MRSILFLSILCLSFLSCDKENNYILSDTDKVKLNKTIDSVYEIYQSNRKSFHELDKYFGLNRNTFIKTEGYKRRYLDSLTYNMYQKSVDSLLNNMIKNDSLNTKLLIDITKKYGFPSNRRLASKISKAYLIFANAPKTYFKNIETLIKEEYAAGRLIEFKKEYILWHTSGRKTLPPTPGLKGEAIWLENDNGEKL